MDNRGDTESLYTPQTQQSAPLSTLDEPISETLMRDVRMVATKLRHVMDPRSKTAVKQLRDWDLWGPLLLCLALSIVLSARAPADQTGLVFAAVFVVVWLGAAVVTVNAVLLGGTVSFFQSVCVLGYCIFPLLLASIVCLLWGNMIFRFLVTSSSFIWATTASVGFMAQMVPPDRKALAVYPVVLFYLFIAWMVLVE
eukprot:c12306_g2_i1.p1 GENE.c12306_g2_i1~~c12306_g2_i1.p1  ORF type:complete len:209 (+),score=37.59 c12306_g2_i1:38-628(+)